MLSNNGQTQASEKVSLSDEQKITLNLYLNKWLKLKENKLVNSNYINTQIEQYFDLKQVKKLPLKIENNWEDFGKQITYVLANDEDLIEIIYLQLDNRDFHKFSSSELQLFINDLAYSLSENIIILINDIWEILNKSSLVYDLKNNLKSQLNNHIFQEVFTLIKNSELAQESEYFNDYLRETILNNLYTKSSDLFATLGKKSDNLLLRKIRKHCYKKNVIFNYYQLGCLLDFCVHELKCDRPNYQLEQFLLTHCQLMTIVDNQYIILIKEKTRNKNPRLSIDSKVKENRKNLENKKQNLIKEFIFYSLNFYRFFFNPFIAIINLIINKWKKKKPSHIITINERPFVPNYQLENPLSPNQTELNQLIENANQIINLGPLDDYEKSSKLLTQLPEKYNSMHPSLWPAKWLLTEKNAEIRRLLIQTIGYDRLCQELNAIIIDEWREYSLLVIHTNPNFEEIHILKMTCPSTKDIHTIRIPPDIYSAREAITWANWDIDPEEFISET